MRAGSLRHRITLQVPTRARNSSGGMTDTWSTVDTDVAANVRDVVGSNLYTAMAEKTSVTSEVRIRWRRDVSAPWRVIFGLRTLEVVFPQDPDGRQREIVLYCKEVK